MSTTIYRQTWQSTFSRPEEWQQYDSGESFPPYDPLGGAYPFPGVAGGEAIKVATIGTLEYEDSSWGTNFGSGGVFFYGIGTDDPERHQVPDDSTYAWDQRDCIHEVTYKYDPGDYPYGLILTLAKGLFGATAPWRLEYFDGDWTVRYLLDGNGTPQEDFWADTTAFTDGNLHRFRFEIQPGTVTGDPLGSFTVASDGYWRIFLDDVLVRDMTGIALTMGLTTGNEFVKSPVHLRGAWLGMSGLVGPTQDYHLFRVDDEPPPVDPIIGSTVFGTDGTVTSTRTFLANLDETPRTVHLPGTFYIGGDLVVTGSTTVGGSASIDLSELLDGLGT